MKKHFITSLLLFIVTTLLCQAQTPTLYGMTLKGGFSSLDGKPEYGCIFQTNATGSVFNNDYSFYQHASYPEGNLLQANNGLLYGMTSYGGPNEGGTIFSYNISTNVETNLYEFGNGMDGKKPYGSLIQASNGLLYGMTSKGGKDSTGTIFSYNISTGIETVLHSFGIGNDGKYPQGSLLQASNGSLYGMTLAGGTNDSGIIFSYDISTASYNVKYDFGSGIDGAAPNGSLVQANNGLLYGMTLAGGANDSGILFSYDITNGVELDMHDFGFGTDGSSPFGDLFQANNNLLYGVTSSGGTNRNGIIFSYNILTAGYTNIYDFRGYPNDGKSPHGSLIQANNGLLYGMTSEEGRWGAGTIYSYNITNDSVTDVINFDGIPFGVLPYGSLIQGSNGLLYGMTFGGGYNNLSYGGDGTIFSYNTSTSMQTYIFSFGNGHNGQSPYGTLIQANNGLLYGTTSDGGNYNGGTIFSYNISTGIETDLHDFGDSTDGFFPDISLVQASDGLLYGMTVSGGAYDSGMIFSYNISTNSYTDVYDFSGSSTDGESPWGSLIQASNGLLYGMTSMGGDSSAGTIFSYNISTGIESVLYSFGIGNDGKYPHGSFLQASNGLLYGMTSMGGDSSAGTIFSYNISKGIETTIHNFNYNISTDGAAPNASLVQANDGLLYGMTTYGGAKGFGIILSYDISTNILTDIHDFGSDSDGYSPYGSLIQASNGLLYGMTSGGNSEFGLVFSYNISTGVYNHVHDFIGYPYPTDGAYPYGSLIEVDSTTGINQLSNDSRQLSIYPNPTSGQFTIKLNNNPNEYTMEVYNIMGEKVYQSILTNSQTVINLYTQPDGIYFVYLKSEQSVMVQKVLIAK